MTEGAGEHDGEGVGGVVAFLLGRRRRSRGMEGEGGGSVRRNSDVDASCTGVRGRWDDCWTAWAEVGHADDSRVRSAACASGVVLSEREAKAGTMRGCGAAQRCRGRAPRISPQGFASASAADSGARTVVCGAPARLKVAREGWGENESAGRTRERGVLREVHMGTDLACGAGKRDAGSFGGRRRGDGERRRECGWFAVYDGGRGLYDVVWGMIKRWGRGRGYSANVLQTLGLQMGIGEGGLGNGVLVSKVAKGSVAKLECLEKIYISASHETYGRKSHTKVGRRGTGSLCHIAGESRRAGDEGDGEAAETLVTAVEGQRTRSQLEARQGRGGA
ncbi:hypothetical protein DFH08DRAFT_941457 [Mycena albidolilacea]|uniref:Uncharacterized protein n=1 Tax=Mycena albidolilacea TaxID=1033008 RepID=A0AAD6ZHU7_9AGAR|nr:hypothetical protein DFH08DRAFT_941457 [Mycena albidolilacea]